MLFLGFLPSFDFDFFNASQENGWEECLQYDLFSVERDVKPYLSQSMIDLLTVILQPLRTVAHLFKNWRNLLRLKFYWTHAVAWIKGETLDV